MQPSKEVSCVWTIKYILLCKVSGEKSIFIISISYIIIKSATLSRRLIGIDFFMFFIVQKFVRARVFSD